MHTLRILTLLVLLAGAARTAVQQDVRARRPTVKVEFQVDTVATNPLYQVLVASPASKAGLEHEIARMLIEGTFLGWPGEEDGSDADYLLTVELAERGTEKSGIKPVCLAFLLAARGDTRPAWKLPADLRYEWVLRDASKNAGENFTETTLRAEVLGRVQDLIQSKDLLIRGLLCYASIPTSQDAECSVSSKNLKREYRLTLPFRQSDVLLDGGSRFVLWVDIDGDPNYHHVYSLPNAQRGPIVVADAGADEKGRAEELKDWTLLSDFNETLFRDHVAEHVRGGYVRLEAYSNLEGLEVPIRLQGAIVLDPVPGKVDELLPPSQVQRIQP